MSITGHRAAGVGKGSGMLIFREASRSDVTFLNKTKCI